MSFSVHSNRKFASFSLLVFLLMSLMDVSLSICGDGIVDIVDGEQCDPGADHIDSCCRPSLCIFKEACICSDLDPCCIDGEVAPSGTMCRPSSGPCDISDVCDGIRSSCPLDAKHLPGSSCPLHSAIGTIETGVCLDGLCSSRNSSCPAGMYETQDLTNSIASCEQLQCQDYHDAGLTATVDNAASDGSHNLNGVPCRTSTNPISDSEQCFQGHCISSELLVNHYWVATGEWSACTDAEIGEQTEKLECVNDEGTKRSSLDCWASEKQPKVRPCGSCAHVPCINGGQCQNGKCVCPQGVLGEFCQFSWSEPQPFPMCRTVCEVAYEDHREVSCLNHLTGVKTEDDNCSDEFRPLATQLCTPTDCIAGSVCKPDQGQCVCADNSEASPCSSFSWTITPLEACSKPCNGGEQSVTVDCQHTETNAIVPSRFSASLCGSPPPPPTRTCNELDCKWRLVSTGKCSDECGGGTRELDFDCHNPNTDTVEDSILCEAPLPSTSEPCNSHSCRKPTSSSLVISYTVA